MSSLVPLHLTDSASALLAEMDEATRDEELANVVALLRSEECTALLCGAECLTYVQTLIDRLERGEHRR